MRSFTCFTLSSRPRAEFPEAENIALLCLYRFMQGADEYLTTHPSLLAYQANGLIPTGLESEESGSEQTSLLG